MKCFLLAAGKGTRLFPITSSLPKCLVEINGKPLMYYWFKLLQKYNITDLFINLHYLPEKVEEYVNSLKTSISVQLIFEKQLLGSLGTLVQNYELIKYEDFILVCYADNLTNLNIKKFLDFHLSHDFPISMGLFETNSPQECGILEMNNENVIVSFEEKPKNPISNLANAGVYIMNTKIFNNFQKTNELLDISYNLLPNYINNMKGYIIEEFIYDIGDLNKLKFAENYVLENINQFDFIKI